jgi:uncharacterized protein HemX
MSDKLTKVGNFISKYWFLAVFLGSGLFALFELYSQIQTNTKSYEVIKQELSDLREFNRSEVHTVDKRNEKRYKRTLEALKEIERNDREKDKQIEGLTKEVYYIKGQIK